MKEKHLQIFVRTKVFLIKLVTLNGIIISTLWKLHSNLSQKNLFRCFQAIRSVLLTIIELKLKDSPGP